MTDENEKAFMLNMQQVATAQKATVPMVSILSCAQYVSVWNKEPIEQLLKACQFALGLPNTETAPNFWHVVDEYGNSVYSASFKQACHDHINDCASDGDSAYSSGDIAKWVVRPLWSKP